MFEPECSFELECSFKQCPLQEKKQFLANKPENEETGAAMRKKNQKKQECPIVVSDSYLANG